MRTKYGIVFAFMCSTVVGAQQPEMPVNVGVYAQEVRTVYTEKDGLASNDVQFVAVASDGVVYARTSQGDSAFKNGQWSAASDTDDILSPRMDVSTEIQALIATDDVVLATAKSPRGQIAVGTEWGLFFQDEKGARQVFPQHGNRRWAPTNVHVTFDGLGRLWFASTQGVGCYEKNAWSLFTGADGLPYDDMTAVAAAADGTAWFGTRMGAIRFDGTSWAYRQGKRWLPHDEVRDIAIDKDGNAWIATAEGVSFIQFKPMTLAEKARFYEDEIDKHHRRTEFGYVIEASAPIAGRKENLRRSPSDNDGLWTSMYGAGECFAYAATKDANAKRRARDAFQALRFLSESPKGSKHAPPKGFIARTVLESDAGYDPNQGAYSLESQRRKQQNDKLWRVYEPRWPKSADGRYYWKSDTSSDELDGHYFFYALYYDLVAESEEEKSDVREIVRGNIDHLIKHDFCMHDHAGRTRWSVYSPKELNQNPEWHVERGLNSISMLSYLNVAHHVTGDPKYRQVARDLRDKHSYHINVMWPKYQRGIGSGNHSDDEMAFMAYYNLIRYETDSELKQLYIASFANSWRQEEPEMNPFFNFCYAAVGLNTQFENVWGEFDLSPWPTWLADSIDTLKRFPLDRFNWRHTNHHRKDLVLLSDHWADAYENRVHGRGYRNNGKVLPVDERYFNHWNHNPWTLDSGGSGNVLGTGAVFTLPYYMGLYHGFIAQESSR